jgi:hypothetical protein
MPSVVHATTWLTDDGLDDRPIPTFAATRMRAELLGVDGDEDRLNLVVALGAADLISPSGA